MPKEHLLLQGVPRYPGPAAAAGVPRGCQWQDLIDGVGGSRLSATSIRKMAGNAMCMITVG
eukprot:3748864-Alexandrium_andersonii.AAC.1